MVNYASFLLRGGAVLIALALLVLGGQYLLPALLPFLLGAAVAVLLRPFACWVRDTTRMRYGASAVAAALLFYGLAALLVCNLGFLVFAQTVSLFTRLPELFSQGIIPSASSMWERSVEFMSRFLPTAGLYMERVSEWATTITGEALSQLSGSVLHWAAGFVAGLPSLFINIFLTVLSSVFILSDYDGIASFIFRQLSPRLQKLARSSKSFLLSTGKNVVKAYFLLMLLTFCEVTTGLWLLGVEYFAVMGILVAVVDVLPVLGSGAVLIPWGVWQVLSGSAGQGAGILLLYAVITVVRTIAEPKILGDRIGLPPLVTILSMYAGLRLFGIAGLILTPMTVTLLVHLNERGHIKLWKGDGQR